MSASRKKTTGNGESFGQRLLRHVRKIQALPLHDQRAVLRHIDAFARAAKVGS